ncbi:MAG: hypothetical protein MUF36_01350 [Bacteroidales bacterium]|jgi:hypothetical protein|nr:hypothetical protein [Bacteroidales bacterium]
MNSNKLLQQLTAIFGIFMVAFYIGVGVFMLFYARKWFMIDKAISVIMGSTFLFFGVYRIFVSINQVRRAFFPREEDEE